jgi:hypothetical protein
MDICDEFNMDPIGSKEDLVSLVLSALNEVYDVRDDNNIAAINPGVLGVLGGGMMAGRPPVAKGPSRQRAGFQLRDLERQTRPVDNNDIYSTVRQAVLMFIVLPYDHAERLMFVVPSYR